MSNDNGEGPGLFDQDATPTEQIPTTTPRQYTPREARIEGLGPKELTKMDLAAEAVTLGIKQSGVPAMLEMILDQLTKLPKTIEDSVAAGVKRALAERAKDEEAERPPDYERRRKIVWLVGRMSLPGLPAIGFAYLTILCLSVGWKNWFLLTTLLVPMVVLGLWAWLVYFLWSITFIVCNIDSTGIKRDDVAWLPGAKQVNPELETIRIIDRECQLNQFLKLAFIKSWTVRLDTAAQNESSDVRTIRGVAKGDVFVDTIIRFQNYVRSIR